jgi:O-antigen/teichoic acid export membrane protein
MGEECPEREMQGFMRGFAGEPGVMRQIRQRISRPLYRNSLFLMANVLVTTALGFFFWMVVARFYTDAEVGLAAAIISALTFLALLSRLGLGIAIIRFLPKAEKPVEMINSSFTLGGIVVLVAAAIFVAGLGLWSPALSFIQQNVIFILAFIFFAFCWMLSALMDFIFIAKRRAEFVLSKNTIISLLKIPLPILMVLFFRAFGIISSWGIATAIVIVISLFLFLPRVQSSYRPVPKLNFGLIRGVWRYSAGNYFAELFSAAPGMILPIMVVNLLGAEQNAYFYVAWMIAGLLTAIPAAVAQSLFAEGSHFEEELETNVRRSFKFVFLLLIPTVILVVVLGKWLLLLFGASYSANALGLLWMLAVSGLFMGVNNIYTTVLRVSNRIKKLVLIVGFVTIVLIVGSYLITPATGIIGVGYAQLAAQGLVCVYALFALRSYYIKRRVQA